MSVLEHLGACRVCRSPERRLVASDVFDAPDSRVWRCHACDLVYLDPIMSRDSEATFYEDEFPTYMESRNQPGGRTPEGHFEAFAGEARRRVGLVSERVRPEWNVLEIGSATGYFLDALKPFVGSVAGVEPGDSFRSFAIARGIPTAASVDAIEGRYDAIFMYYLLEHIRDPVPFMEAIGELLLPEGRVFIEVPNVDDALISTYRVPAFGPFYWQRAHLFNYSHRTLRDVLVRAGFESEVIPEQRYDLSNHLVWMLDGKPGGKGRFADIFDVTLESAYAETLKRAWICDTVFAVARRPG